ncbi:MAG: FKBP-type peptidyl-prolyl cis-trans isomerase [Coriobacteriales bacterium]|jgi:FKBP-type peptidyl-prolyl cis-trans isomerase|nr:FKBP-type peptidyl-prolyl cis-trans isomerase [Coriobacteriales bacterium]
MKTVRNITALVLSLMLAFAFIGCTKPSDTPAVDPKAVAATVNGVDILESDVTKRAEYFRLDSTTGEPADDATWAGTLKSAGYTPETFREFLIRDQFALPIVVLDEATKAGITPDTATIDAQLTEQKTALGDDAAWQTWLSDNGFSSEAAYRQLLEASSVVEALLAAKVPAITPNPTELETYILENASYFAGKRVSLIYFPLDAADTTASDTARATAGAALTSIESGEDFATIADANYNESYPTEAGGDLGWGGASYLPTEVTTALATMAVGDVSGIIETSTALFIVSVTDEFVIPEDGVVTDVTTIPEDVKEQLTGYFTEEKTEEANTAYFETLRTSSDIVINPMPEGLSYNVDMTLANVQITDTLEGTGEGVKEGDLVTVHYTGTLDDGTVFDSSVERNTPYSFTVGAGEVIPGWEEGLLGMKVGGKRTLVIPPALAYGATENGAIPANSVLHFDIELISINDPAALAEKAQAASGTGDGEETSEGEAESSPEGEAPTEE